VLAGMQQKKPARKRGLYLDHGSNEGRGGKKPYAGRVRVLIKNGDDPDHEREDRQHRAQNTRFKGKKPAPRAGCETSRRAMALCVTVKGVNDSKGVGRT